MQYLYVIYNSLYVLSFIYDNISEDIQNLYGNCNVSDDCVYWYIWRSPPPFYAFGMYVSSKNI